MEKRQSWAMIYTEEPRLDLEALFQKGYWHLETKPEFASFWGRKVAQENFILMPDEGAPPGDCQERYLAGYQQFPETYQPLVQALTEPLRTWLQLYRWKGEAKGHFARAGRGYQRAFHSDINDQSILNILFYMMPEAWAEKDGGELVVARQEFDPEGNPQTLQETGRIVPKNGTVIILENRSPFFRHKVLPWTSSKKRYLMHLCLKG